MAWALFIIYLVGTTYLGVLGSRKTKDFSSFAIGDGNMSPLVVGITLAASTASAATFIVNPGFVYTHGLSAFMHLGVSVFIGIMLMLCLASYKFRQIGAEFKAVTIPHWLGLRYGSRKLAIFFSLVNMLSFAFLVLLVGGISIVMQQVLDVSNITALLITLIFVTAYVIIGGTYAHVFTNLLQGSLMLLITIIILIAGVRLMNTYPNFWLEIQQLNPDLLQWVNPNSELFGDYFSVYVSGILIGAALVCQPHILTKALYVKDNRSVSQYLLVFAFVYFLFSLLLLAGFWALLTVPEHLLIDPSTNDIRQDLVMTQYLQAQFPEWLFAIISVILLAAAMSTLDGLLVGLSTIIANDFWLNLRKEKAMENTAEDYKIAFRISHIVLVILAICAFFVSLNPPKLLGIYGQFGVYALVLTSLPAIINGLYFKNPNLSIAWVSSISALVIYLLLYLQGDVWFGNWTSFSNPAVPASIAIMFTCIPASILQYILVKKK